METASNPSHPSQKFMRINFEALSPEEFREFEKSAYNGQLDFNAFPAAEYRYFDRLQNIGYRVRHEGLPMDFAKRECDDARTDYQNDVTERNSRLEVYKKYQQAIIRRSTLVCMIEKAKDPIEKLKYALEFVELTLGEDGFKAENLRDLEDKNND